MKTAPATLSGKSAARIVASTPDKENPTTIAVLVFVASMTASAASANAWRAYPAGPVGLLDLPLPRQSNVSPRKWRARYGICAFQTREYTSDHVGRKNNVGEPLPKT